MTTTYIAIQEYCERQGQVDPGFIQALYQSGLIHGRMGVKESDFFIDADDLAQIEQFSRFYYEMDINLEGIEAIAHLLSKIENLQAELNRLQQHVTFYTRGNSRKP